MFSSQVRAPAGGSGGPSGARGTARGASDLSEPRVAGGRVEVHDQIGSGGHLDERRVGARDHRGVERQRLEQREAEALLERGEQDDRRVLVAPAQRGVVGAAQPDRDAGGFELGRAWSWSPRCADPGDRGRRGGSRATSAPRPARCRAASSRSSAGRGRRRRGRTACRRGAATGCGLRLDRASGSGRSARRRSSRPTPG